VFITARQFNQNPENWASNMCRLAARDVPPGGSFLKNPELGQNSSVAWQLCIAPQAVSGNFQKLEI